MKGDIWGGGGVKNTPNYTNYTTQVAYKDRDSNKTFYIRDGYHERFTNNSDAMHVKGAESLSQLPVVFTIPSTTSKLRTTAFCALPSLTKMMTEF